MSAAGNLNFDVAEGAAGEGPYRFERRTTDRWPSKGVATLFHLGGPHFGQMHEVDLLDYGDGGLCARADEVVEPGAILSIGFQDPEYLARRGLVTRCEPCGDGYRVAIRFEGRLAA